MCAGGQALVADAPRAGRPARAGHDPAAFNRAEFRLPDLVLELVGVEEMKMVALLTMFEQGNANLDELVRLVNGPDLKSIH